VLNYDDYDALKDAFGFQTARKLLHLWEDGKLIKDEEERNEQCFPLLRNLFPDEASFTQALFWIRTDTAGSLVQLKDNLAQQRMMAYVRDCEANEKPIRCIILKSRRQGVSTRIQAMLAYRVLTIPHFEAFVVAHENRSAREIFGMTLRMLKYLPFKPELNVDRRDEIQTTFDSKYTCLTAANEDVGRGFGSHWVHLSEIAFYPDADSLFAGLMNTIGHKPGTAVFLESTANGVNNLFCELWGKAVNGENDFFPIFLPWHEDAQNTMHVSPREREKILDSLSKYEAFGREKFQWSAEQIAWRRHKVRNSFGGDDTLCRQEYPSFPEEAFLVTGTPVFSMERIEELRRFTVDPAQVGVLTWAAN